MVSWSFIVAVFAVPALLVLRSRAGERVRETTIATSAASWAAASALAFVFPGDPSDIGGQVVLMLGLLPLVLIPVASLTATTVARRPNERTAAAMLAAAGWAAGLVIMFVIPAYGVLDHLWDRALAVLAPAIYAASGATYAATRAKH